MITKVKTIKIDGKTIGDGITWERVNCSMCGEQMVDVLTARIIGNRLELELTDERRCPNHECKG